MSNTRKTTGSRTAKAAPAEVDIAALLGEDARAEDTVSICLRANLRAQWSRLKAEFDAGPGDDDQALMVDRAAKRRVAEQMAKVEAQMRAGTVEFRLRALPRRRTPDMPEEQVTWQELVEAHPPRKDDQGKPLQQDATLGINRETFFDALVRASVVEPELTEQQWTRLDAKLTDAQFDQLAWTAWHLNRGEVDVPFSRAASMIRTLDAESRRRSNSASPSADSKGGSRDRSRPTNTTNMAS